MKHEDYVSFKQAVELKKLGFNWETDHFYGLDDKNEPKLCRLPDSLGVWDNHNNYHGSWSAPTLTQAQSWMLEKFGLWIEVTRDTIETKWFNCEINHADDVYREWVGMFDNTFVALSEGINKATELLKENGNGR